MGFKIKIDIYWFVIILLILTYCSLLGCKNEKTKVVTLIYSLYEADSLIKENALEIKYDMVNDSVRKVLIQMDTLQKSFTQKSTKTGIYVSFDKINYNLTYSLSMGQEIESNIIQPFPFFANSYTTAIKEKSYYLNRDNLNVICFGESIPPNYASYSYYVSQEFLFLLFYNFRNENYYKLSKITGMKNSNTFIELANKVSHDTLFFSRFFKLPKKNPPLKFE